MLRMLVTRLSPAMLVLGFAMGWAGWSSTPVWAQDEDAPASEAVVAEEEEASEEEEAELTLDDFSTEDKLEALFSSLLDVDGDALAVTSRSDLDALWTCLAAFLVFFMQAGFLFVEIGFTRAKNAVNLIMKNISDFMVGTITFWLVGFGLMFGTTYYGWFGTDDFMFSGETPFEWAFLLFQTVFCATAATIVAGSVAERTKFGSYLIYSVAVTAFIYPVFGSWAWGSLNLGDSNAGWLEDLGFLDFAGSTVVHSIGGWSALAGAIVVGARLGKYSNGKVNAIPGQNIPAAALGVFILWLGWFGFNPGSTTAVGGGDFAMIAVNTNLSAAGGVLGAMLTSWVMFGKPDASFTLNGALGGLVAITAGCDVMEPAYALMTGIISGPIMVFSVLLLDNCRIDDPVGAVSVHGTCGAYGTLMTGVFGVSENGNLFITEGVSQLGSQAAGVGAGFVWGFGVSFLVFMAIKLTLGLRVSEQAELEGLDVPEHGLSAYPPSQVVDPSMK